MTEIIIKERGAILDKKWYDNPPNNFFPREEKIFIRNEDGKILSYNKCDQQFDSNDEVKSHVKICHKEK